MADDRGGLGQVEALALRQALDDVDQDHVSETRLGDPLRRGCADVPGADDRDLVAGHSRTLLQYLCFRLEAPVAERPRRDHTVSSVSLPVAALVVIGILLVVLGLFAPAIQLLYVGIGAIVVAGVLAVLAQRRS